MVKVNFTFNPNAPLPFKEDFKSFKSTARHITTLGQDDLWFELHLMGYDGVWWGVYGCLFTSKKGGGELKKSTGCVIT